MVAERKQEEAGDLQAKVQTAVQAQMDTLAEAKDNLAKAADQNKADAENKTDKEDQTDKTDTGKEAQAGQESSETQSESNPYTPVDVRI